MSAHLQSSIIDREAEIKGTRSNEIVNINLSRHRESIARKKWSFVTSSISRNSRDEKERVAYDTLILIAKRG